MDTLKIPSFFVSRLFGESLSYQWKSSTIREVTNVLYT